MSEETIIRVSDAAAKDTLVNAKKANAMRTQAKEDPEAFWADVAKRLDWSISFTKVKDVSYDANDLHIRWFYDGELNACVNCLDRHLPERADDLAMIWESDDPGISKNITYKEAFEETCRMANVLKARGVKRG